jgi:beta-phosphoglucomutase-like phosphatase (HAD superfamily)
MKEFILQLRQEIEERKAAMQAQREELKEERKELQDEFVENVQGMSRAERVAAIMEKVAALKERLKEKMNEDADEEQSETEEEVDYVGMTTSEAQAAAKENGVPFRIGMLDGDLQLVTLDYRPGRITAEVENDIVVNYSVE